MRARLYDGVTSAAHDLYLVLDPDAGLLRFEPLGATVDGVPPAPWPLTAIRRLDQTETQARFGLDGQEGARLLLSVADAKQVALHCPALDQRPARAWSGPRVALWCVLALLGLAGTLFILLPRVAQLAARALPRGIERQLGARSEGGMVELLSLSGHPVARCADASGQAALNGLTRRLAAAGGLQTSPVVHVLNSTIVNAFALPGGRILILSGLLAKAEGPSVLAGVLGHEMGHIVHRDPTEAVVRNAGIGLLMGVATGDLFGGSAAGVASLLLLRNAYSRDAERTADAFALATLAAAHIESAPLSRFYQALSHDQSSSDMLLPSLLSTHPDPGDRAARVERDGRPGDAALSEAEWQALRHICDVMRPDQP